MPSEFIIPLVPHEPVILYFGEFYHPLTVSLVAIAGTVLTERLNYSLFKYVTEIKSLDKIKKNRLTTKLIDLFNKAPFLALIIAGFTPIPFHPFRFLVVFAGYPVLRYILAVFISRTPRFFILALLGHEIHFSTHMYIVIFIIFFVLSYLSVLRYQLKNKKNFTYH
ncbi:MAG: VTT domain-containing protein [bacterium]